MLLDHYLPHLFENFEQFSVYASNSVPVSCTINRLFWLLCFLHCALWYNYATRTNETDTFQINTSIQYVNFWHLLHASNHPENEPTRLETCRRYQKFKNWIKVSIWKVCISLVHVA